MSTIKETVRRINSGLLKNDKNGKTITFITPDSSFFQATVIANLAIMYGRANESTIIVDTDFGNDSFSKAFGISTGNGLQEYLESPEIKQEEIIAKVKGQNVSLISSGNTKKNTRFLLDDPKFRALLKDLTKDYDHVLISTSPFEDFRVLESPVHVSNGVIIVSGLQGVSKRKVYKLIASLKKSGANIFGYLNVAGN